MTLDLNPQAEQMGDESMERTLDFQAQAIWPQEAPLFARYNLAGNLRILDLGCGTGEITRRLAAMYPQAQLDGVDILESNLAIARAHDAALAQRVRYTEGDAFALTFPDAHFDLVVCRHMSQCVPHFERVLAEITRVLKPHGWLHLLSEDYGMLHMPRGERLPEQLWIDTALPYLASLGCDGAIGRHSTTLLDRAGYGDVTLDYVVVDTLRVPRSIFAGILIAWRDGYVAPLAAASGREPAEVRADFDAIIHAIETPPHYAVWQVPIIAGRRPA